VIETPTVTCEDLQGERADRWIDLAPLEGKRLATANYFNRPELTSAIMPTYRQLLNERRRSSGHQDREARVVQGGARDAAEYQFVQAGVTISAHDEEIRAERGREPHAEPPPRERERTN